MAACREVRQTRRSPAFRRSPDRLKPGLQLGGQKLSRPPRPNGDRVLEAWVRGRHSTSMFRSARVAVNAGIPPSGCPGPAEAGTPPGWLRTIMSPLAPMGGGCPKAIPPASASTRLGVIAITAVSRTLTSASASRGAGALNGARGAVIPLTASELLICGRIWTGGFWLHPLAGTAFGLFLWGWICVGRREKEMVPSVMVQITWHIPGGRYHSSSIITAHRRGCHTDQRFDQRGTRSWPMDLFLRRPAGVSARRA
jgi:hypothetical protein